MQLAGFFFYIDLSQKEENIADHKMQNQLLYSEIIGNMWRNDRIIWQRNGTYVRKNVDILFII